MTKNLFVMFFEGSSYLNSEPVSEWIPIEIPSNDDTFTRADLIAGINKLKNDSKINARAKSAMVTPNNPHKDLVIEFNTCELSYLTR